MRTALASLGIVLGMLPMHPASACAPPPPGYVYPTPYQRLESFVGQATDIVYGVVRESRARGEPSRFEIIHVYRGERKKGEMFEALPGWDHPEPFCAGMAGPPLPKPVGTYGVIAFRASSPQLSFIKPDDVQTMIERGWIQSARVDAVGPGSGDRVAELPIARFHERTQGYFRFNSGMPNELMAAIRRAEDWRAQWRLASAHFGSPPPEPEVDFEKDMLLIAAMGPRGSGGYSVDIERVVERSDELIAHVRFTSPGERCGAIAVITSPADIVRLPKSEKTIRWEVKRVTRDCS